MRGELFEEDVISEFFEENEEDINEYPEYQEKLNPLLSSDIIELQKQHMIILEYVKELEKRNEKLKNDINRLQWKIKYLESEVMRYEKIRQEFRGISEM